MPARNDGGTVPVLVHGSRRLIESAAILAHADALGGGDLLYPRGAELRHEVAALEAQFDTQLGPHVRRRVYAELLSQPKLPGRAPSVPFRNSG